MKMSIKIIVAISMIGLITEGHAQLYCYVCENCPDGNNLPDEFLVSCSGEGTTTEDQPIFSTEQPTTPPVDTTIAATIPSTEISTSESSTSPEQSTQPLTEPTTEITTETSSEASTQNTDPSIEPTTEQTSNISTITIPESPITTTSMIPAIESTLTTSDMTTATVPTVPPTTTSQPIGTPPILRGTLLKQSGYNCYVIMNETQHVNRGCVAASPNSNDMCRKANENVVPPECRVCGTDKCNTSNRVFLSAFLFLCSISTILSL